MKILVLGASGMLGHKVVATLAPHFEVAGTVRTRLPILAVGIGLKESHLFKGVFAEDFDSITNVVATFKPQVVINCIGIIKQLSDAHDPIKCLTINSLFPHRLAKLCTAAGVRCIHISTDCVFSGNKGHYTENDNSDAEDLYGRTKFLGEISGPCSLTLRTSIIGRELGTRNGLVEWFLTQKGGTVRGFKWAIYSGLTTQALSRVICRVIEHHNDLCGVWHVAADPIDKYSLLTILNDNFNTRTKIVSEDKPIKFDRSLDGSRFSNVTGIKQAAWPELIQELVMDSKIYPPIEEY